MLPPLLLMLLPLPPLLMLLLMLLLPMLVLMLPLQLVMLLLLLLIVVLDCGAGLVVCGGATRLSRVKKETTPHRICEREGVVTCYYRPECYPLVKRNKREKKLTYLQPKRRRPSLGHLCTNCRLVLVAVSYCCYGSRKSSVPVIIISKKRKKRKKKKRTKDSRRRCVSSPPFPS
jgi:hypothetical protein